MRAVWLGSFFAGETIGVPADRSAFPLFRQGFRQIPARGQGNSQNHELRSHLANSLKRVREFAKSLIPGFNGNMYNTITASPDEHNMQAPTFVTTKSCLLADSRGNMPRCYSQNQK